MQYDTINYALDFQLLLVFLIIFLGTALIYEQWKKPKRKLPPGPVGLPIVGYLPFLRHEPHKALQKLSKKYGNIIGLNLGGRYTVVLNEYTVMKEGLSHPAALHRASHIFDHISPAGFSSLSGKEWQDQRQFSMRTAKELGFGRGAWENMSLEIVSSFIEELNSYEGSPVIFTHSLNKSLSDNVISLLIGRQVKKGEEDDKIQLGVDFSNTAMSYTGPSCVASVIPKSRKFLEMLGIAGYDWAAKINRKFRDFLKEEIARHKTQEYRDFPDFINMYIRNMSTVADDTNQYFSEDNLEGNLKVLFLGGSDTISSSLTWLLCLMAHHKDIQERVHKELLVVLGPDGIARYEDRHKFPYTFALLMESQRVSSIVPLSTTRCAAQNFTLRGYTIPKGTEIFGNIWAVHNDPDYWHQPEKFKPERFLESDGTLVKQPKSYAPFSIGRRNCPGEVIAWREVLCYFSEIIRKFEITAPPNQALKFNIVNGLVSRLEPQPLCFVKRKSHNYI